MSIGSSRKTKRSGYSNNKKLFADVFCGCRSVFSSTSLHNYIIVCRYSLYFKVLFIHYQFYIKMSCFYKNNVLTKMEQVSRKFDSDSR